MIVPMKKLNLSAYKIKVKSQNMRHVLNNLENQSNKKTKQ